MNNDTSLPATVKHEIDAKGLRLLIRKSRQVFAETALGVSVRTSKRELLALVKLTGSAGYRVTTCGRLLFLRGIAPDAHN